VKKAVQDEILTLFIGTFVRFTQIHDCDVEILSVTGNRTAPLGLRGMYARLSRKWMTGFSSEGKWQVRRDRFRRAGSAGIVSTGSRRPFAAMLRLKRTCSS